MYLNIAMFFLILSLLIWSMVVMYTIYEYLIAWTEDSKERITPKFVEVLNLSWSYSSDGEEAGIYLLGGLLACIGGSLTWPISFLIFVMMGVALHIRSKKRKEKEDGRV